MRTGYLGAQQVAEMAAVRQLSDGVEIGVPPDLLLRALSRLAWENSATYLTSPAPPSTLLMLTRATNGSSSLRESHISRSNGQWREGARGPGGNAMWRRIEKRRVILWPRTSSPENPVSAANARLTSTITRLASRIAMPSELFS